MVTGEKMLKGTKKVARLLFKLFIALYFTIFISGHLVS